MEERGALFQTFMYRHMKQSLSLCANSIETLQLRVATFKKIQIQNLFVFLTSRTFSKFLQYRIPSHAPEDNAV